MELPVNNTSLNSFMQSMLDSHTQIMEAVSIPVEVGKLEDEPQLSDEDHESEEEEPKPPPKNPPPDPLPPERFFTTKTLMISAMITMIGTKN